MTDEHGEVARDDSGEVEETGLVPPAFHSYVGSMYDGQKCASAVALAASFGGPVYEPTMWPDGAGAPHYVLPTVLPPPFPNVHHFRIFAELPGHPLLLLVNGMYGPPPSGAGENGWYAHSELSSVNGIVQWNGAANVIVERNEGHVHLSFFPSVDQAVRTALSLRRVDAG